MGNKKMKMMQQEGVFRPIAVVLETEADVLMFWDIINQYIAVGGPASEGTYRWRGVLAIGSAMSRSLVGNFSGGL